MPVLKFNKHNSCIMSLHLTFHVNLEPSLRKSSVAMYDLFGIKIFRQSIANYARTASLFVKSFIDNFDCGVSNTIVADKTYIKIRCKKERLNRSFKSSYRVRYSYDILDCANYDLTLWICYYNFLRHHKFTNYNVLNHIDILDSALNTPAKWHMMIFLGQQYVLNGAKGKSNCVF